MKKALLIFLVLSTLAVAKEEDGTIDILVNPSVRSSQSEVNKDKEDLKKSGKEFLNVLDKMTMGIIDYYSKNGSEMEKKVLRNMDRDINFDHIIDYNDKITKEWSIYNKPKLSIDSIGIITDDTARINISEYRPNIDITTRIEFDKNISNMIEEEIEKNGLSSDKNVDEYISRFFSMKPTNYVKGDTAVLDLKKIDGNWEIFKINGKSLDIGMEGVSLIDLLDVDMSDVMEMLNGSDDLSLQFFDELNNKMGLNLYRPEIIEGIVLRKDNSKFKISKNEIKDIVSKVKKADGNPFRIELIKEDVLTLDTVSISKNGNKKGAILHQTTYKKENGKWVEKN